MIRTATVDAPAKVNLHLRILHRRPDGFHQLETLFQAVSLADEVVVSMEARSGSADRSEGRPSISLHVDGPDLGPLESNLAYRAAQAFLDRADIVDRVGEHRAWSGGEVRIELAKRIPAGAGLGGGSSDAAAVLKCLAALTDFHDVESLHHMAADLGSDVPFFLSASGTAWGRGRGEELTEVDPPPTAALVLALPPVHVDTGGAYAALAKHRASGGAGPGAPEPAGHDPAALEATSRGAVGWDAVASGAVNDFEPLVAGTHPEVEVSLSGLRSRGARLAMLSGSGAASFGLFSDSAAARAAAAWLEGQLGWPFVPVTTLKTMPIPRIVGE